MSTELASRIFKSLNDSGFPMVGAVDWEKSKRLYSEHVEHFDDWVDQGFHHRMDYLVRGRDRRRDPTLFYPELKSVVVVGLPYSAKPLGFEDPSKGPKYARYLRGKDYHVRVKDKMVQALSAFKEELDFIACVDTSAVLERAWGAITGIGWIGKNSMLIHPQWGSYFLIGVAFLNRELGLAPAPRPDYCGSCERCLKGCPTDAFQAPRELDSRKCISAWTLETRGDAGLSKSDQKKIGSWIAGCDICQEVCPFNTKREKESSKEVTNPTEEASYELSWNELESESEASYRARVKPLALSRIKPADFQRNRDWAQN